MAFELKLTVLCVVASCLVGGSQVLFAAESKSSLEIIRVKLDKKSFDPSEDKNVNLSFEITRQADVKVGFYDFLGREVKNFSLGEIPAGRHSVVWDGNNEQGKPASGSIFLFVIRATGGDGQAAIYNRAKKTGGKEVQPMGYTLDRKTGHIEYVLPKACMVRIRAGIKDGMFARLLFGWEPQAAGRHSYKWDGKDNSGWINLLKHQDLDVRLSCYTLPDNTVIVKGDSEPFDREHSKLVDMAHRELIWQTKGKYLHYRHDPYICHQPRFKVLFPGQKASSQKDIPLLFGVTPMRIELDSRDERHLTNTRFEIMLFIDGIFVYEIEEGSSPFTYNWDTKAFANGPHIVTVNLVGYDDHIGIVSRKVIIGD